MTKQEQIEEMRKEIENGFRKADCRQPYTNEPYPYFETQKTAIAKALYSAGYRKVLLDTENGSCVDCIQYAPWQLVERKIEELKSENKQLKTECALLDDELRLARQETINVLNELKGNIKNAIDTYYNSQGGSYYSSEDVINDIDKMIKELVK